MTQLNEEYLQQVLVAASAACEEMARSLSRAWDAEVVVSFQGSGACEITALPPEWLGPGLVLLMRVDGGAAAMVMPEACGVAPEWIAQPNPAQFERLQTLGQELSLLLLPDLFAERHKAGRTPSIAGSLADGGLTTGSRVDFEVRSGDRVGTLSLVWPLVQPAAVFLDGEHPAPQTQPAAPADHVPHVGLPSYIQSLLRIRVPVSVKLAQQRQPVGRITELNLGTMIQFDKQCWAPLELTIGERTVAIGEAVKVGEKFGLRITKLVLPEERFKAVQPQPKSA